MTKVSRFLHHVSLPEWQQSVYIRSADIRTYLILTTITSVILALRQPNTLLKPQFVVEDGMIFFAQAYNLPPIEALTQVYAGYWHAIPRLIAELGMFVPLSWSPLFYRVTALLLTAAAISWLVLPHHRPLIKRDGLRIWVVLLIALMPRLDGLMLVAYVQWYLAFWAILITLAPVPDQRWARWLLAIVYALVVFSVPALIITIPLWLLRWSSSTTQHRQWSAFMAMMVTLAAMLVLTIPRASGLSVDNLGEALQDLARGISYNVFALTLLGAEAGNALILQVGWWASYVTTIVVIMVLTWTFASDKRPGKHLLGLYLFYIAGASTVLYLVRAPYYDFPFASSTTQLPTTGTRYFFVAALMLLVAIAVQADHILRVRPHLRRILAIAGVSIAILYLRTFSFSDWPASDWPAYARLLSDLSATQSGTQLGTPAPQSLAGSNSPVLTTGWSSHFPFTLNTFTNSPRETDTYPIRIPIAPAGWFMTLNIPTRAAGVTDFPEGLRLLDYQIKHDKNVLAIDLFWIGEPAVAGSNQDFYTAYVHLMNDDGERIAGYDVLLMPDDRGRLPETVFRSQHPIQVPSSIVPGSYHFAIGLYHFVDADLIPGSSIVPPARFTLP